MKILPSSTALPSTSPLYDLKADRFDLHYQCMKSFTHQKEKLLADKAYALIISDLSTYDSISDLSGKLGTNPVTLKRVFKKHYGVNIFQFSRTFRLEKAKALLLDTDYTLQTIAGMVGYSEGNNFQVAFKDFAGMNPGDYRRQGGVL